MSKNKDFIGKSDSWASWLQRIKEIIDGDKIFWGWTLMTFASSFIAPIKSSLELPLTIILFTGIGAAIFLIVSLLWREYKENKGLKNMKEQKNIEFEDKIRGDIIAISDKRALGEITIDQATKMIEARLAFMAEEIKAIKPVMMLLCSGDGEYSKDDYDKFYSLWKNFQPLQKNVSNLLLTRAALRIPTGEISKQAIEFLLSITDDDLEILKKQFKYVLRLPHQNPRSGLSSKDLAIWGFENSGLSVQDILLEEKDLIHLESYHIKFYGDVWLGENARSSFHTPQIQQETIFDIDIKGLNVLQISIKEAKPQKGELVDPNTIQKTAINKTAINFPAYVCLSEIGTEIFNLLKDELEPVPSRYLSELVLYWNTANPKFDFKLNYKPKLITNDNT